MSFDQAMKDLTDPMLPVRAHGLIVLRRLVLEKDPAALSRLDVICNIFHSQLRDTDSYVYLNAIYGLSALADVRSLLALVLGDVIWPSAGLLP
jgi:hypothetical protein